MQIIFVVKNLNMREGFKLLVMALLLLTVSFFAVEAHSTCSCFKTGKISDNDSERIEHLIRSAYVQILKPGEIKTDLDSAAAYLKEASAINEKSKDKTESGQILLAYSNLYRELGNRNKGFACVNQAVNIFKAEHKEELLGDAYAELSQYYSIFNDNETATIVSATVLSVQAYRLAGNTEKEAHGLEHLADFHQCIGNDSDALNELHEALNLYDKIHYHQLQGVYDLLGWENIKFGNYQEALKFGLLAEQNSDELHDSSSSMLATIYNHLAITWDFIGDRNKSLHYLYKALKMAQQNNNLSDIYDIGLNIMSDYNKLDKPDSILSFYSFLVKHYKEPESVNYKIHVSALRLYAYISLDQFNKAENLVNKIKDWIEATSNIYFKKNALISVISFYIRYKQIDSAKVYLTALNKLNTIFYSTNSYSQMEWTGFQVDSVAGDYKSAMLHLLKYEYLNDSIRQEKERKYVFSLQVKYETDKKDKDIQLLNSKSKLQQTELAKTTFVKNATLVGIAVLLIIIILVYNQYRISKQGRLEIDKKNKMLAGLLNEKEWLLKEIHHRVKNNLQMVTGLLEAQSAYAKGGALEAINDSRNRIYAMALVHQKLYQLENIQSVICSEYLKDLVNYLKDSFDIKHDINFIFDVDDIQLEVSQAVPVGLIINEAVTNAVKYAFPCKNERNTITITLKIIKQDEVVLSVSDNGKGFPEGFVPEKSGTLGMKLIKGLNDDLEGELIIESTEGKGTSISIKFKKIESAQEI